MDAGRKLAGVLLIVVFSALHVQAKPAPPFRIELTFQEKPALNEPVSLAFTLHSRIDLGTSKVVLDLPEGVAPLYEKQKLYKSFDVAADGTVDFAIDVMVKQPGEYQIAARFVTKNEGRLVRVKRFLYLVITEKVCVYTNRALAAARREAILEEYRLRRKLPSDGEMNVEELPPEVLAALAELSRVEAAAPETSAPVLKPVSQPAKPEAADTEEPDNEENEVREE